MLTAITLWLVLWLPRIQLNRDGIRFRVMAICLSQQSKITPRWAHLLRHIRINNTGKIILDLLDDNQF